MISWINTYPHTIYASVLLLDNKIVNWKVGENKWESILDMYWKLPLPENINEYIVKNTFWVVNSDGEHQNVFNKLAPEWYKQWEILDYNMGFTPYDY